MTDLIKREDAIRALQCVTDSPNFGKALGEIMRIPSAEQTEPKPCEWCKFYDGENCFSQEPCKVMLYFKTEPQTDCSWK